MEETEPEIAARAKQLLSDWPVDDIRGKSDGAGVFHEWVCWRFKGDLSPLIWYE